MSIKSYRFDGGKNLRLQEQPTGAGEQKQQKAELKAKTAENLRKAALLAEKLYAAGTEGLVIAIQARDAAGKDSLVKHVFSALNPQAMEVHAFKTPTSQELSHDYLWRIVQALPPRGKVGILNRSHYEDVLVVKVHHLEKTYRMAPRCLGDDFFEKRPEAAQDCWLTTTKAPRSYQEARFSPNSWIFFGKETAGLPMDLRERFRDRCIRLPMIDEARSLNLSNTVAVCVYEALRQNDFPGLLGVGEMAKTP